MNPLRKELDELKNTEEHLEGGAIDSVTPKDNFVELFNLSQRTNSRFKINGDFRCFTLAISYLGNYIGWVLWLILTGYVAIMIQSINTTIEWIFAAIIVIPTILLTLFGSPKSSLKIDSITKEITFTSNNFIGISLKHKILHFREFDHFFSKTKTTKGARFNRVYLQTENEKFKIIDLVFGPIYFVNHNIFMTSLTRIIKNAA
jgi:hypothetical protein